MYCLTASQSDLELKIATQGLASPEAIVKASNGASELGPVSAEKVNEVFNANIERSVESMEARRLTDSILRQKEMAEAKLNKIGDTIVEVKDTYNLTMGTANRAIIAYTNRAANRDKFINKLS